MICDGTVLDYGASACTAPLDDGADDKCEWAAPTFDSSNCRSFGALKPGWLQGEELLSSVLTLQLTDTELEQIVKMGADAAALTAQSSKQGSYHHRTGSIGIY